ncbi:MAG: c-type cytochrome, partial [Pseudomonadota bacterium]|nr:c-type cytochrome [Pseudomonadota bacterium]
MLSFVPLNAFHKIWRLASRTLAVVAFCQLIPCTTAAAEREHYNDRYCTTCHGTDGRGNEGTEAPRLAGMEDWYLRRQLENFRAGIRG